MQDYIIGIIILVVVSIIMILSKTLDLFKYRKYGKSRPDSDQRKNNKGRK